MRLEENRCPICELINEKELFKIQDTKLARCQSCNLIYLNPKINKQDIMKFYPHTYHSKGGYIRQILERKLTQFNNFQRRLAVYHYKRNGKILDLGCGKGQFLKGFNTKRWERYGVEPNPLCDHSAFEKNKIKIYPTELIDCHFPESYFDVVTAWVVLEYIDNPRQTLEEIKRILKCNGIFIFSTPNAGGIGFKIAKKNWLHLDFPRHIFLYRKDSLRNLLHVAGFKIVKINCLFLDCPLDLFRSMMDAEFKSAFFNKLLALPFLIISIYAKLILYLLSEGEMIQVVCIKR